LVQKPNRPLRELPCSFERVARIHRFAMVALPQPVTRIGPTAIRFTISAQSKRVGTKAGNTSSRHGRT
jgi:hypothetical protein